MALISCGVCFETGPFEALYRPGCNPQCNEQFKTHAHCLHTWFETASRIRPLFQEKCPHCQANDPLRQRTWRYIREGVNFLGALAAPFFIIAFCNALVPQTKKIANPHLQKFCEESLRNVSFALAFPHIVRSFIPLVIPDYQEWLPRL